jgi:hypothetical protein
MKKMASLFLSFMLALVSFGGSVSLAENKVDFSEHKTFTIWLMSDSFDFYSDYSENPAVQYINNKFNVTLQFQQPAAGTEQDSLSLMFGTGEYTDMVDMSYYTGSIEELFQDNVIIDIAEYLEYMPNLSALLKKDDGYRKSFYNDEGRILTLRTLNTADELIWGSMAYRRDILETMTGGNIAFPSGNTEPITIEDWEYMLPLFKQYFEAAGMTDYAPLILPSNGVFAYSEIVSGFGVGAGYYVEDGIVKYGPLEDGFYNYLAKMKEWYNAGYIYQDFASRTTDPFYLPNTSLTYGGAAGAWFALNSQLGDAMSMPEYGLHFDFQPMSSPLDTEHGITAAAPYNLIKYNMTDNKGFIVTKECDDIPKLLSVMDYVYSEEGGMLYMGLTVEQGATTDRYYVEAGLQDGAYWFDGGKVVFNPLFTKAGGTMNHEPFMNNRLPGIRNNRYDVEYASEIFIKANTVWSMYADTAKQSKLPSVISRPVSEDVQFTDATVKLADHTNSVVPQFIMGTLELNEKNWDEFKQQLIALGLNDNLRIQQDAYNRYLDR